MKQLRILYINNTAGAMTPVVEYLVDNGHKAVIVEIWENDPYKLTSVSPHAHMVSTPLEYIEEIVRSIQKLRPTHIHINSNYGILSTVRHAAPYTPIVMHYHGVDIRGRRTLHPRVRAFADKVIVSTPELSQYGDWYGCPISSRFSYQGGRIPKTALHMVALASPRKRIDYVNEFCDTHGLKLTLLDLRKNERVPSEKMPEFLSTFEYYIDFKGIDQSLVLSKTALEALLCGCKVVHDSDPHRAITRYPSTQSSDYLKLYESIKPPSRYLAPFRLALAIPISYIGFARFILSVINTIRNSKFD